MPNFKDLLDLLLAVWRWIQGRKNPAYAQAARILRALNAHGVKPTQINSRLPENLRLKTVEWSSAERLKDALTQGQIDWFNNYLKLDPYWVEGVADRPHIHISCYKNPRRFQEWLTQNHFSEHGLDFKLHLITVDGSEISAASSGPYAVVLQAYGREDEEISRYYHLMEGARFDHRPGVVHLMELLAIAHCHGIILQRSILPLAKLAQLSNHNGLIPEHLWKCRPNRLAADHEFWGHFSGNGPWLTGLRDEAESNLVKAALPSLVGIVNADRVRFARS
ncbi:hypothetical protein [Pseudomonas syringae]|uniref:hypothetical protein n=1 Tax=Pseudomonas syringae TaxID=317 RepID=UPI000209924D|nr:hypothetical protein [Pseudomonas syringae]EGH72837.1 hypothetical protein PSYAR_19986 [Pseudomonas syringae pv. aceris str. M302273]